MRLRNSRLIWPKIRVTFVQSAKYVERELIRCSHCATQLYATPNMAIDFILIGIWKPAAKLRTEHIAAGFVQIQGDLKPLFAGHGSIKFDLLLRCGFGSHGSANYNGLSPGGANTRQS